MTGRFASVRASPFEGFRGTNAGGNQPTEEADVVS